MSTLSVGNVHYFYISLSLKFHNNFLSRPGGHISSILTVSYISFNVNSYSFSFLFRYCFILCSSCSVIIYLVFFLFCYYYISGVLPVPLLFHLVFFLFCYFLSYVLPVPLLLHLVFFLFLGIFRLLRLDVPCGNGILIKLVLLHYYQCSDYW